MSLYFALLTVENNKNKKTVKFQGDMVNFYDFIQVFVFTTYYHLNTEPIFIKRTYLLIIQSKRSSRSYSTICSCFPHKSEQILFSVFRLCSDFCGKLLYIVEKHLDKCATLTCFVRIPARNSVKPIIQTT